MMVIQIAALAGNKTNDPALVALCDDGSLWILSGPEYASSHATGTQRTATVWWLALPPVPGTLAEKVPV